MAAQEIIIYGDPVLREVAEPVEKVDQAVKDLVSMMVDTLKKAHGLGLAAPQVGVSKRVFIVDLSAIDITAELHIFINPEIIWTSENDVELEEGCLSFPGIYQRIVRPSRVRVRALGLDGKPFEMEAGGMAARAILHEYDHLEGVLFIDHISPIARTLLKGRLKKLAAAS
ncbi:MAG: peptide deformylase [candidate division Zixibacteria bacterium]|nr:peptide deformylase [candidate division Zixibacteria bacterium]